MRRHTYVAGFSDMETTIVIPQVLILHHSLVNITTVNPVTQELMMYITVEMYYGMANNMLALTITVVLFLTCHGFFDSWPDL